MMARREYSEETKAAVMAALLTGQSISVIAKEYKIPPATIRSWKSRQANGESVAIVATEKKREVGELLLEYLREAIATLVVQQTGVFRDKEWLKQQSASEMAVLGGVTWDKLFRLLEALDQAAEQDGLGME